MLNWIFIVLIGSAVLLVIGFAVFDKHIIHHAVSTQDSKRLVVGSSERARAASYRGGRVRESWGEGSATASQPPPPCPQGEELLGRVRAAVGGGER